MHFPCTGQQAGWGSIMLWWSQPSLGCILHSWCQEPLSIHQQKRIMEEAQSVNALSKALATLKIAAEFLAVTGGDPEHSLLKYVQRELKMDAGAKQFQDVPVGEGQGVGGKWDLCTLSLLLWAGLCTSRGSHLRDTSVSADRPGHLHVGHQ